MIPVEVVERILEELDGRVRFKVAVKPESDRTALVLEGDELVFYTEEPDVAGRPVASLKSFIARALGVSGVQVEVVGEGRGSVRVVEIRGLDKSVVAERLAEVAESW